MLEDLVGEAVGERGDREARVRADGAGHHRAVGDVQAGIAEHVAVRVDDALAGLAAHRGAAERVDGDHALEEPDRVVGEAAAERMRHRARRRPQPLEVGVGAVALPVDVEPAALEVHAPVRHVAAHAEQRQAAGGQLGRLEQVGDVARHVGVRGPAQPVLDQVEAVRAPVPQRLRRREHVQDPRQVLRVAGVLQVEAAALAAVERVGHPRRARDHRAVARIDDPRHAAAVGHLGAVERQRQQVAVAAEARAELAAEPRERAAVAQQQVGRAERARRSGPGGRT